MQCYAMRWKTLPLLLTILLPMFAAGAMADSPAPTVIVVDSSGSMAAQLDGEARLDTARHALADLLEKWPADAPVGVIAYGHRRASDCKDIEELVPIGPVDPKAIEGIVGHLQRGMRLTAMIQDAELQLMSDSLNVALTPRVRMAAAA